AGRLDGGFAAWVAAGLPVADLDTVGAGEVRGTVLDVRQDAEYADGRIPGAVHVEAGELRRPVWRVPRGPLTVMCAHGDRAMTAASLLRRHGHADLTVAIGRPDDWSRATGQPLERSVA
ncbi:MAG: rhodanese-like domain-containing protein, partial [Jiangellaceae bacterium]